MPALRQVTSWPHASAHKSLLPSKVCKRFGTAHAIPDLHRPGRLFDAHIATQAPAHNALKFHEGSRLLFSSCVRTWATGSTAAATQLYQIWPPLRSGGWIHTMSNEYTPGEGEFQTPALEPPNQPLTRVTAQTHRRESCFPQKHAQQVSKHGCSNLRCFQHTGKGRICCQWQPSSVQYSSCWEVAQSRRSTWHATCATQSCDS